MSLSSFVGTTNDCVSEPIWFPLGLITYLTEQKLPEGSKSLRGEKIQTNQENFKQIPLLHPPGNTCESSSVLSWKRKGSLREISFVVSSSPDSAWFGHYNQDLLLRMFAVLSECSCWETFSFYSCISKLMENITGCSVVWAGSPRSLGFLEYKIVINLCLIYIVNLSVERCHPPGPSFPKPHGHWPLWAGHCVSD